MKSLLLHKMKFFQFIFALSFVLAFISCSENETNEEPLRDGEWSSMEWKQIQGCSETDDQYLVVPSSGATYKFTCLNYDVWLNYVNIDGVSYYYDKDNPFYLSGDSFEIEASDNELTVTIKENTTGSERIIYVGVWCMDVYDYFAFRQKAN